MRLADWCNNGHSEDGNGTGLGQYAVVTKDNAMSANVQIHISILPATGIHKFV